MFEEGEIVLAQFEQADGQKKKRPALILRQMPGYGDYLVCGLSSQLHQEIKGFDFILNPDSLNGLKVTTVVRLGFLSTKPESDILGSIGELPKTIHSELLFRLTIYLKQGG